MKLSSRRARLLARVKLAAVEELPACLVELRREPANHRGRTGDRAGEAAAPGDGGLLQFARPSPPIINILPHAARFVKAQLRQAQHTPGASQGAASCRLAHVSSRRPNRAHGLTRELVPASS